jgi:ABC-type uncharacterized transport system involved in gliding motility auxiliary subunit
MVCTEGVYVDLNDNYTPSIIESDHVRSYLSGSGIRIPDGLVLDASCRQISVPGRWPVDYPHWVAIDRRNTDPEHPVTNRFGGLDVFWPGRIVVDEQAAFDTSPIISTTTEAWLMNDEFHTNPYKTKLLTPGSRESKDSYVLGIAGTHRQSGGKLLVIGDADFATNLVQYSMSNHNLLFFENALQWLADSEEMLALKSRTVRDTRLNRISDEGKKKRLYATAQTVNVVGIPLLILLSGAVHLLRRKRRRKSTAPSPTEGS